MGYNLSANTTTLTARLTPIGRKKLVLTNNNLVTSFSLGDSDANYYATLPLTSGYVPTDGGDMGPYGSLTNSVGPNVAIKSYLTVNSSGKVRKNVESQSNDVAIENVLNGFTTISGTNISQVIVNRTDINTDQLVNLYYSFNLPLDTKTDYKFTGLTSSQGGYSNTTLSGAAQTKILVIALKNSEYGELLDGKSIKLQLETTLSAFTIYSTYQNTGLQVAVQDANFTDTASNTKFLGNNIAFLFSDEVQRPNNDGNLSWAAGYGSTKPFGLNGKQLYNMVTDTNVNQKSDNLVGIAYLDKGFLVITNPVIVDWFDVSSTATTVTFNTVSTSVVQNITCIANRGEFGNSTNPTYKSSDTPRISEIGLYDIDNDLIAIAKTDRHLVKNVNEFMALGIKISV
jgi:hypothetical protein